MGEDEEGTLATFIAYRTELIEPCIAEHSGRRVGWVNDAQVSEEAEAFSSFEIFRNFQKSSVNTQGVEATRHPTPPPKPI